ncbi:Glycosylphosphatidylinositol (GPI) anchor assembly protein [Friedmanniomyces endolithicus]|nr:Glycosylphosphatidylinositol (GPI) anchor assembly protein [Friedmanniomyces endolithicus]
MTTPTKPDTALKPGKPLDLLQTQPSLFFANLQPILLLGTLLLSFRSLVADPVNTLLFLAPTIAIVQALYCIICLPSTGDTAAPATKPGQKKKTPRTQTQDIWAKVIPVFLSLTLTALLSTPLLYTILILFGAPLTTHHLHTLLLAVHLALLTTPHLFYVHGLDATAWLRIASLQLPVDEVYGMSLGACVGAWLGAIPIPLDWDREWQKWPVTVVVGMYGGAIVGKLVGGYLCRGWRIQLP